jgi:outer membrane protein assembly factor BamB
MKKGLALGIIFLFLFSALAQISIGLNVKQSNKEEPQSTISADGGPMDSPWSMLCHDLHHTSLSPYSTADNQGYEKWRFRSFDNGSIESSPVVDNNGTIYIGTMGDDCRLYAIYPNGTMKWKYQVGLMIWDTPTIAEDGTIYVVSWDHYLYAINHNGSCKWRFCFGIYSSSSPAIGQDGTIYCGASNNNVYAINPNGTLKWTYSTGGWTSSAAIGDDGIIYIGSEDNYLYAFYPNGTLKWRFKTGDWVKGWPSIASDGTIYAPSFDGYFYALNPNNGTMIWRASTGGKVSAASVAIATDDTLYVGTDKLRAYYPDNGTIKWYVDIGGNFWGTSPAISYDGTIYGCADRDGGGGYLVAVNPDGTIKWKERISNLNARSSPCIDKDGTVYVGSSWKNPYTYDWYGYLHAFNQMDSNAPTKPEINGPNDGKTKTEYNYSFKSMSPLGNDVYYYVDWGDGYFTTSPIGPYNSGEQAMIPHTWKINGTFTIKARCKDTDNLWGPWGYFNVTIKPKIRAMYDFNWMNFLERFPILQILLNHLN